MFATTFLGHQGWMFRSSRACVLVDPLLCEHFGQGQALDYCVYPPRIWRPEALPPVDAVIISHEHDDHFDVPSLARLDRAIPIHLSGRSSVAAHTLLREMGFKVLPLVPGLAVKVHDLEVHPLVGDHVATDSGDEWDALPLVARQAGGDGSFFTAVDLVVTSRLIEAARRIEPRPCLVGWTNNTLDRSFMTDFQPEMTDGTRAFADALEKAARTFAKLWGEPAATLICGGGFAFWGERSFLNRQMFCVDPDEVARLVDSKQVGPCFSPRPGQTYHTQNNALIRVDGEAPFLTTAPVETWPSRKPSRRETRPDYAPATRRREMLRHDVDRLLERLQDLADALLGSRLFRSLYSLSEVELPGRRCTFALVLRHEERAGVFEYNPNACRFDRSQEPAPRSAYLAGLECWATDLLAVLSGDLAPIAISFGRASLWNAAPERFDFCLLTELHRVSHPLRHPAAYLRNYREILAASGSAAPTFRARR